MDRKMRKVTKKIRRAEKDIRHGHPKDALKTLKKAEHKNEMLANFDEKVRDPQIEKFKKMKSKGC
jgi:hypothetical protein